MTSSQKKSQDSSQPFSAEVDRVLEIVTHALYQHRDIFLRELLSNAADAFDKRRFLGLSDPSLLDADDNPPSITLATDKNLHTLAVTDRGIGMSSQELKENLGTIARSGTKRFLENTKNNKNQEEIPGLIGQFGMGFYASFMVADKVTVTSKKAGETKAHIWESNGKNGFSLHSLDAKTSKNTPVGTTVTLQLKEDAHDFLKKETLSQTIDTYARHIGIEIILKDGDEEEESLQTGDALWRKPPSQVSQEDLQDFYRSHIDPFGTPWTSIHKTLEGLRRYTLMLFIPSQVPFDIFSQEFKNSIRLYVQRVFITDNLSGILPGYLRFVRGIVETDDMPLNVSRDSVQESPVIAMMKKGITSRILSLLAEKAKNEPDEYLKFWNNFGAVLKEGLYAHDGEHDSLFELARFRSTHDPSKWISLQEYTERMKPEQKTIYTLTSETTEQALASPQLEGFLSRNFEVLLLTDPIDSFWTSTRGTYKDHPFRSVTRLDENLEELSDEPSANPEKNDETTPKKTQDNKHQDLKELCEQMKTILKDEIGDVTISHRLTKSPVCLVSKGQGFDIHMERLMKAQGHKINTQAQHILEINPKHELITTLKHKWEQKENIENLSHILLAQARLLAGENIHNPARFVDALNDALARSLNA